MSPKRSTPPTYLPDAVYPARDAHDVRELADYFQAVIDAYTEALAAANGEVRHVELPAERLRLATRLAGDGFKRAENLHRLLAELSTNEGVTQRTTAARLRVAHSSVAVWRFQPRALDDLELPPRPSED
jgi:hypothetical protein